MTLEGEWRRLYLSAGTRFGWHWTHEDETRTSISVRVEPSAVVLIYRCREGGNEWEDVEQRIPLSWTACNLGGEDTGIARVPRPIPLVAVFTSPIAKYFPKIPTKERFRMSALPPKADKPHSYPPFLRLPTERFE